MHVQAFHEFDFHPYWSNRWKFIANMVINIIFRTRTSTKVTKQSNITAYSFDSKVHHNQNLQTNTFHYDFNNTVTLTDHTLRRATHSLAPGISHNCRPRQVPRQVLSGWQRLVTFFLSSITLILSLQSFILVLLTTRQLESDNHWWWKS